MGRYGGAVNYCTPVAENRSSTQPNLILIMFRCICVSGGFVYDSW